MEEQVNIPALLQFFDGVTLSVFSRVIWLRALGLLTCSLGKSGEHKRPTITVD